MYDTPKQVVTIIRKWNNPEIEMHVNCQEVGIGMALRDFLNALKEELSPSIKLMTTKAFSDKFDNAADNVIATMKKETIHIV